MNETNRKKRKRKIIIPALFLIGAAIVLIAICAIPRARKEDYKQIASSQYDTVFLSMYPIDTYSEEEFLAYRGMTLFKASYCLPDFTAVKQYMRRIAKSGNAIRTVYLGVLPDKTDPARLQALIDLYPSAAFEIIIAYPSADYWSSLSDEEYEQALASYCGFLNDAAGITNAHFYYMGSEEWLISNPGNYLDPWLVNADAARAVMLQSDVLNKYLVTGDNAPVFGQALTELTRKIRTEPEVFPDLSDYNIVFFGDSVIGNYTDSTSIPEVAAGLSGATVFNCGLGGNSATVNSGSPINLPGIAEAFVRKDLSMLPEGSQVYKGVSSYMSDAQPERKMCFVFSYGLNDYFAGYPIEPEEDPRDVTTFKGAVRTALDTIHAEYPDAMVILCTPTFCFLFNVGTDLRGEGHVLKEYLDAVISLSEEFQVSLLDTYYGLGVTEDTWSEYLLPDCVHPNETYRYLIGREIVRLIGENL